MTVASSTPSFASHAVVAAPRSTGLLARGACLLAIGSVLGLVESWLVPALPLPGVRLGLANIAVVLALALLGDGKALAVSVGRVIVVGAATGSLGGPASALAAGGALAAWAAMVALRRAGGDRFSVIGWSAAGSAAHVLAQIGVACVLAGSLAPLFVGPVSVLAGLFFGVIIGYLARLLLSRLPLAAYASR